MAYSLAAIGWVPNISRDITSDRHISFHFRGSPERMGTRFTCRDRHIFAERVAGDCPDVKIELMDDSGLCHIYIDMQSDVGMSDDDAMSRITSEVYLCIIWNAFRSFIDSSSNPEYSPSRVQHFTTDMAKYAVCSAMDAPIPISQVESTGGWANAIAKRFLDCIEVITDSLRTYSGHNIWSNPKSFLNRHKVIDRSLGSFMTISTNAVYFRSFISIYSDAIDDIDTVKEKLDLRLEKTENAARFIEEYMEITNLEWLLTSVIIALAIGCISLTAGIWT